MWKLKTYVEGEYSVFERNEAYWGEKPGFRYLRTVVCSSAEEAAEAMKAGEADVMGDSEHITPELFKELEEAGFGSFVQHFCAEPEYSGAGDGR